jgi:radical SAM protein with 4Fe4S-binding SPASM domain
MKMRKMKEQQQHHRHVVLHVVNQNQNYQKLRKCSGCHAVQYCNSECQKNIGKLADIRKSVKIKTTTTKYKINITSKNYFQI